MNTKRKEVLGKSMKIYSNKFSNGNCKFEFELGDDFGSNLNVASQTLRFISDSDIYYNKKMVVEKGSPTPFYNFIKKWSPVELYENNKAIVSIDLRPNNNIRNFKTNLLNNGVDKFGKDFIFNLTPCYNICQS